eukprot:scaffold6887_cov161-Skeletonema_menzelii.AAC.3
MDDALHCINFGYNFSPTNHCHLLGQNTITSAPTTDINPPATSPTSGLALSPSNAQPIKKDMTMKKPPYAA